MYLHGFTIKLSGDYKAIYCDTQATAVVAEWLRRVIRNHLGSPRVGSNPADSDHFLFITVTFGQETNCRISSSYIGLEINNKLEY